MARSDELILISKEIDIKNCTYHYFSDMININEFNRNKKRVDKNRIKIF